MGRASACVNHLDVNYLAVQNADISLGVEPSVTEGRRCLPTRPGELEAGLSCMKYVSEQRW